MDKDTCMSIGQAAKRTSVSERILRYYDEKGLLRPSFVSQSGRRGYTEKDLVRLQEVLLFRECGFELKEIRQIMRSADYDPKTAMQEQLSMLEARLTHVQGVIAFARRQLEERTPDGFEALSHDEEEELRAQYKASVIPKAKGEDDSADTLLDGELPEEFPTVTYTDENAALFTKTARQILALFGKYEAEGPEGSHVQKLVSSWQWCITRYCYPCSDHALLCLGLLYVREDRWRNFINSFGAGDLSALMCEAIKVHVGHLRP